MQRAQVRSLVGERGSQCHRLGPKKGKKKKKTWNDLLWPAPGGNSGLGRLWRLWYLWEITGKGDQDCYPLWVNKARFERRSSWTQFHVASHSSVLLQTIPLPCQQRKSVWVWVCIPGVEARTRTYGSCGDVKGQDLEIIGVFYFFVKLKDLWSCVLTEQLLCIKHHGRRSCIDTLVL